MSHDSSGPGGLEPRALFRDSFWSEAFTIRGAVTRQVLGEVLVFAGLSLGLCGLNWMVKPDLGVGVTPYEVAGAALGLLLVLRTNAGYDRWWEARKLWGGIVNQTRALAIIALAQGPEDPEWRDSFLRWTAAFGHVCRRSLRGQRTMPEVVELLGRAEAERLAASPHMPGRVVLMLASLLNEACERHGMDRFVFVQAEHQRNLLLDHIGGCERILKSPLPKVYGINIRRFIFLFLVTLPFGLLDKVGWLTPVIVLLIAYPVLALDQIGVELQNPFRLTNLGHLALDDISMTVENDIASLARRQSFRRHEEVDIVDLNPLAPATEPTR